MKPQNIKDLLLEQKFRAWMEVRDALSSQEQKCMWGNSFFDEEDHETLLQAYDLYHTMTIMVQVEVGKQRENSQA
jgi:hypothetical protein